MRKFRNSRRVTHAATRLVLAMPLLLAACKAAPDAGCDPMDVTCGDRGGPPPDVALYVDAARGLDSNAGTRTAPFATVQTAIDRATSGQPIRVAGGSYPQALQLRSGLTITGGFDGTTWQQGSQATFVGAGSPAVTGTNVNGVVLEGLVVQAADATSPGQGSIAMALMGSSVTVRGGRIVAGRGADGAPGRAGSNGAAGGNGSAGRSPVACVPGATTAGGSGGGSGIGRAGGTGGYSSTANAGAGIDGAGRLGGRGGSGGSLVGARTGRNGASGGSGSRGQDGRGGEELGGFAGTRYTPADGSNGSAGEHGGGGGGGGGGAGGAFSCGATGAGGGAGGAGGAGAPGGSGGGASIAVLLSGGSLTLDGGVQLVTANGGRGGDGGRGGNGGSGGIGGVGRAGNLVAGASGAGGRGGNGGAGGHGGGGGGGPAIGVLQLDGASLNRSSASFHLGSAGEPGRGPGNPGQPGVRAETHTMN